RDRAPGETRTRNPGLAQGRGSVARLCACAGGDRALPAAARARHPTRHTCRRRLGDPAVLRLADREAHRVGRESRCNDRAVTTRARRARSPWGADDARSGAGDPRERRVPQRAVFDELPRRDSTLSGGRSMSLVVSEPAGTIAVTPPALAGLVVQAAEIGRAH